MKWYMKNRMKLKRDQFFRYWLDEKYSQGKTHWLDSKKGDM